MRKIHPPAIWVPPWLGTPRASAGFTEASRPSLVDPGAMACSAVPSEMAPLLGATWKRPATPPTTAATWRAEVMLGPWGARSGLGKTGGPIHDLLVVEPCWTWNMWFPWQKLFQTTKQLIYSIHQDSREIWWFCWGKWDDESDCKRKKLGKIGISNDHQI